MSVMETTTVLETLNYAEHGSGNHSLLVVKLSILNSRISKLMSTYFIGRRNQMVKEAVFSYELRRLSGVSLSHVAHDEQTVSEALGEGSSDGAFRRHNITQKVCWGNHSALFTAY